MSSSYRSVRERRELGKSARRQTPRSSHAEWSAESANRDPIQLIEQQNADRLDWLVPVRRARMLKSPFAFYRAGARLMAHDLATTPDSGLIVQACGDAHLSNFGLYASPERKLIFDLNDFDETLPGPWEWDLKRLVTSVVIAARHNQLGRRESQKAAKLAVESYRQAMSQFAQMRAADVWYMLIDEAQYR